MGKGIEVGGMNLYRAFRQEYANWKKTGNPVCLEEGEQYYWLSWVRRYHPDEKIPYEIGEPPVELSPAEHDAWPKIR